MTTHWKTDRTEKTDRTDRTEMTAKSDMNADGLLEQDDCIVHAALCGKIKTCVSRVETGCGRRVYQRSDVAEWQ